MLSLVVWGSLFALPPLIALTLLTEGIEPVLDSLSHLSGAAIGAILFIAYPSTLAAFAAWNWLLHSHSLSKVAPFTLLVPIWGILGAVWILGEPLYPWKILAALLVLCGLALNSLGPRLRSKLKKEPL